MIWLDNKERLGALLILLFSLAYLRLAVGLPVDPTNVGGAFTSRTLPVGLAVSAIVLSLIQVAAAAPARISEGVRGYRWRTAGLLLVAMTLYALTFEYLGFLLASSAFLLAGFVILGERRILRAAAIAAAVVAALWALFTQAFGLYLDAGVLFQSLVGAGP